MMEIKDNEVIGLKSIIVKYLLHWRMFLTVFALSFIPAVLYLVFYPRTYEIMARIQILEEQDMAGGSLALGGETMGLMRSFGLGGISTGSVNIEDELSILTSNALLKKMVNDLGVNVDYKRPYSFYRLYDKNPLLLTADSITRELLNEDVEFMLRHKNGEIHIQTESDRYGKHTFVFPSFPAHISLPNGNFTLDYAPGTTEAAGNMNITFHPASWVAEELADEFLIEELSKTSTVVELTCTDYERNRGVNMLNRLIERYNNEAGDYKQEESAKTLAYLDARIDTLTRSLRLTEGEIAIYKNTNTLTDVEHDVEFYIEQMRDIQVKLIELESQTHLLEMMDEFVKNPDNKYNLVPILLNQEGGDGSPLMVYNEILVERARVIQNSNPDNPLAINLTKQVDQLRESVFMSISNAQKAVRQAIGDIKEKEKALFARMESFPDKERDFIELKRRQEILQGVYLIMLQKREEVALNIDLNRDRAKVLDAAFVKSKPIAPRKLYAAIGMLFFTLMIPVVYLFCKEQISVLIKEYRRIKDSF
ncbi:MAG: tyrosine protein kinase [Tannerellaceae bacterium]|jgi:uncharacterized protein involved in exopolysaccharide biosynthesis|nr:tyrosine protein kinase [Tannerellaceae bacterium]